MDTTILVEKDIEDGRKLVEALDRSNFNLVGALWFYFADSREWRLLLVSPLVDTIGPSGCYRRIQSVLKDMSYDLATSFGIPLSRIAVKSPWDSLIRLLKMAIQTDRRGISKIRFTRNTINGVFIEDALIYRLS